MSSLGAGTALAADASLPNEPLHGVKLATEEIRLGLAQAPDQRVAVLLDIAEARLGEATELQAGQRDAEADAAVSAYGEYIAEAAAQVQTRAAAEPAAVEQFRSDVRQQQAAIPASQSETSAVAIALELRPTLARENQAPPHQIAAAAAHVADKAAASVADKAAANVAQAAIIAAPTSSQPASRVVVASPTIEPASATTSAPAPATAPVSDPAPISVTTQSTPVAQDTPRAADPAAPSDAPVDAPPRVPAAAAPKPLDADDVKKTEAAAKSARESAERAKHSAEQAKQAASKSQRDKGK